MKRSAPYSIYALIIALLVHTVLLLLIVLFNQLVPPVETASKPPKASQKEETRFRLALREMPSDRPEAAVSNTQPKIRETLSIPRGEQMIKPPEAVPAPQPIRTKPLQNQIQPPSQSPMIAAPQPEPKKKAFIPISDVKKVAAIERTPKPEPSLHDIFSVADPASLQKPVRNASRVADSIRSLYGDKFNDLSEGEQKYILDNQEMMRRITQAVLDRYAASKIPDTVQANDNNIVEFYLFPDGSISDIKFLKNSQISILDTTTKNVIELAYAQYPHPQQKTLIRYRVFYDLRRY